MLKGNFPIQFLVSLVGLYVICFHSAILNRKYRNVLLLDQPIVFSCSNFWEKIIPVVFHVDCVQRRGFSSERFS